MTQHNQTYLQNSALFFSYSICKEFEDIIVRALTVPKSTEELVEMGRYMLYANTTFNGEDEGRVGSNDSAVGTTDGHAIAQSRTY